MTISTEQGLDWQKSEEGKKFWIIIGSRDASLPAQQYKRHYVKAEADMELHRLASQEKGRTFYLLEALERCFIPTPVVKEVLK